MVDTLLAFQSVKTKKVPIMTLKMPDFIFLSM